MWMRKIYMMVNRWHNRAMEMRIFILSPHIMETFRKLSSMSFSIRFILGAKSRNVSIRRGLGVETRKVKRSERGKKLKRKFLSNEIDYKVTIKSENPSHTQKRFGIFHSNCYSQSTIDHPRPISSFLKTFSKRMRWKVFFRREKKVMNFILMSIKKFIKKVEWFMVQKWRKMGPTVAACCRNLSCCWWKSKWEIGKNFYRAYSSSTHSSHERKDRR